MNVTFVLAAPFQNVEKILTQPDGSKLYCFASGDEFYSRIHDKDGYTIVQAENGYFVYATTDNDGKIIATQHIAGKSDPKALGLVPNIVISRNEYMRKRKMMEVSDKRDLSGLNHGVYNNLVIFIKFKGDSDFRTTQAEMDSMFNGNGYYDISMNNYFQKNTYNQLSMKSYCYPQSDSDKVLAYEDIYPRKYYTPYNATTNPEGYKEEERGAREFALLKRAVEYIAKEVPDTLNIDRNSDGFVDNVIFVVKGNVGDWSDLLWPHMWELHGEEAYIHDKRVMTFNFQLETSTYFTVSTLCHEMAHSLGFPDLYHYKSAFKHLSPTGPWDLMCTNSNPPQHHGTYMKYKYGTWIEDIPEIGYGTYTIEANSWEGGRRNCYKIATDDPNQFYLVEFRNNKNIFEKGLPNGGLLIYRLDTRFNGCIEYNANDTLDELYIFRPGGSFIENGTISIATFSKDYNRTEFNSNSNPKPYLNLNKEDNNINICNISEIGDQMTFSYYPPQSDIIPTNLTANVIKDNYVELEWNAVENADSYSIYRDGILIADNINDNKFKDEYHNISEGYHSYYVSSKHAETESFHSNEVEVIVGDYCEYIFDMKCSGNNGWQGGEITLSFDNGMKDIYMTMYSGTFKTQSVVVPAGIEMSVDWTSGWNDSECSFTISKDDDEIYKSESLKEGKLITIITEGESVCVQPQHLTAELIGCYVKLSWHSIVENEYYTVMRDGEIIADDITSTIYNDMTISNSGTYHYTVMSKKENCNSKPSNTASATLLKYNQDFVNLTASYYNNSARLKWNVNTNSSNTLNYDDGKYIMNIGASSNTFAIHIPAEDLAIYKNSKITSIEIFDACATSYNFNIYNGDTPNNNTLIHNEVFDTENTQQFVTLQLSEEIGFDIDKDLWLTAKASSDKPIPCATFMGNPNSNLIKVGSSWRSASDYSMDYSWLVRLNVSMKEEAVKDMSYDVYRNDELIASDLKSTSFNDNIDFDPDVCYHVKAVYNNHAITYSNKSCITEMSDDDDLQSKIFPNPTHDYVNIKADKIKNVKIFSLLGSLVFEEDVDSNELKVDVRQFGKGVYILQITTETEILTEKIVVD